MAEPLVYCALFQQLALDHAYGINSTKTSQVPRISIAEWEAIAGAAGTARQLGRMLASDHEALRDLRRRLRILQLNGKGLTP